MYFRLPRVSIPVLMLSFLVGCKAGVGVVSEKEGCGSQFKPSELLLAGSRCDGERVLVRGFLRFGSEKRGLWDSKKDIEESNFMRSCVTILNPKGIKISEPVRLADVRAIFHSERPSRLFVLGDCSDAILEVEKVTYVDEG